jgi:hypothetical protein
MKSKFGTSTLIMLEVPEAKCVRRKRTTVLTLLKHTVTRGLRNKRRSVGTQYEQLYKGSNDTGASLYLNEKEM